MVFPLCKIRSIYIHVLSAPGNAVQHNETLRVFLHQDYIRIQQTVSFPSSRGGGRGGFRREISRSNVLVGARLPVFCGAKPSGAGRLFGAGNTFIFDKSSLLF